MGSIKSDDMASADMGNLVPYIISFSNTTTGFGSRMAAFNNPEIQYIYNGIHNYSLIVL